MQINKTINLLTILIIVFFIACKTTKLNEEKYIKHINESKNGFLQEKKIGEVEIKLLQKPSCLVAGTDTSNHYENNLYFNLSYSANNKEILMYNLSSFNNYSERVNVLSFRMSQYICLVTDKKDTLRLLDAIFERTYGASNASNILVAFDKKETFTKTNKLFTIFVKDIGIGIGDQLFEFKKDNIKSPPRLEKYNIKK